MDVIMSDDNAHIYQTPELADAHAKLEELYDAQGGFVTTQDIQDNGLTEEFRQVSGAIIHPEDKIVIPSVNLERTPQEGTHPATLPPNEKITEVIKNGS